MGKDPAVLFYTSDFLTGTAFLSMEQRGQYITLLCEQHQNGHIPKNHMISICYSIDSPVIKKFVVDDNGLYYNIRMEEEKIKRVKFCESRSNNKSGRKKKNHKKITNKSYDNHKIIHMENENENENIDIDKNVFEQSRKIYPGTKRGLNTEFEHFKKTHDWKNVLPELKENIERQIEERKNKKRNGNFVPDWQHFKTYINQRSWELVFANKEEKEEESFL